MAYKLVCVLPFHGYEKGQEVTNPTAVADLSRDREGHFVRVAVPDGQPAPAPAPAAPDAPSH